MPESKVKIINKLGIHARPASMIVELCSKYDGDIKLEANGMHADAKSILSIMMLAAEKGTAVKISVNGTSDDEGVLNRLNEMFEKGFGEE
ncbi:MAG: HPr family phosphocarrier protein [Candidatus Muiribacterium halophilum]|uniref:HPr family phosphocarrier protein n=1 Tax=Muiribacterium halophilum TaxID=2053465 RepID=A0A2N5ZI85_MUIH1|nr:MAG: HPr family phosphocarrier protein [Candidatus Muirbacterium halophilum]